MQKTNITLRMLEGEETEMVQLQHVLEAAPTYSHLITGSPAGPADAQSMFSILPPDKTYDDKFVFGVFAEANMVGCVDLIRGYPVATTAHIGLLLIQETDQRQGIGAAAHQLIVDRVQSWGTCRRLRIGIVNTNARVFPFWQRMGYSETGEVRPYSYGPVNSEVKILERTIVAV